MQNSFFWSCSKLDRHLAHMVVGCFPDLLFRRAMGYRRWVWTVKHQGSALSFVSFVARLCLALYAQCATSLSDVVSANRRTELCSRSLASSPLSVGFISTGGTGGPPRITGNLTRDANDDLQAMLLQIVSTRSMAKLPSISPGATGWTDLLSGYFQNLQFV